MACLLHKIKKIYVKIMARRGELGGLTKEFEAMYNPSQGSRMSFQPKYGWKEKLRLLGDLAAVKVRKQFQIIRRSSY